MIDQLRPYTALKHEHLRTVENAIMPLVDLPGAIVECGVMNGGAAMWMWHVLGRNRHLWLFDSWQGVPPPDPELDGGKACAKYQYRLITQGSMCKGDLVNVFRAAQTVGIPLDLLHIVPGWFHETVPDSINDPGDIVFLHLDGDWYESTSIPLQYFWDNIVNGGMVMFDDYNAWQGARDAANWFAQSNGLTLELSPARIIKHGD